MGMASEKMESEATMHHMLRDNLYANRKQVELQGHLRYRKVNNIDADRISIDMKVNYLAAFPLIADDWKIILTTNGCYA